MEAERKLAIKVIHIFNDLLHDNGMDIPDRDRDPQNKDNESPIYGETYYALEDEITNLLQEEINKVLLHQILRGK